MNPGDRGKNGMLGIVESVTYGPHSRGQGTTLSSSTNYSKASMRNQAKRRTKSGKLLRPIACLGRAPETISSRLREQSALGTPC
jgi:hypothetical protein